MFNRAGNVQNVQDGKSIQISKYAVSFEFSRIANFNMVGSVYILFTFFSTSSAESER